MVVEKKCSNTFMNDKFINPFNTTGQKLGFAKSIDTDETIHCELSHLDLLSLPSVLCIFPLFIFPVFIKHPFLYPATR